MKENKYRLIQFFDHFKRNLSELIRLNLFNIGREI